MDRPRVMRRQFMQQVSGLALVGSSRASEGAMTAQPNAPAVAPSNSPGRRDFFYRPENAWAGDFIPFYKDGRFHLFYLPTWRDIPGHGEGTAWYQVSTADFVNFAEHGEMLARGRRDEQDLYVFTGSVLEAKGRYHIFYTGHNPHFKEQGRPQEAILHAVSDDLVTWQKLPDDKLFAPPVRYEPDDWRDPFVFWNDESREYWMLTAARIRTRPSRRRGCTALCASQDLQHWEVREPFYSPGLYSVHECPDLFQIGDWWYLIFSEGSEQTATRYRMSRTLRGPWIAPANDTFDCRSYYAAKTASDGRRRYLFGWDPTRDGERDAGRWRWGGNLVVHELVQAADGTLAVKIPDSVDQAFGNRAPVTVRRGVGESEITPRGVRLVAPQGFGCSMAGAMPDRCKIEASAQFEDATRRCGLMLRASGDLDSAYFISLEPQAGRLVMDSWPRAGDVPYWIESERTVRLTAGTPVKIKVLVDGSLCVVYLNDQIAMSTRIYDLPQGDWGAFVNEGVAEFTDLGISVQG